MIATKAAADAPPGAEEGLDQTFHSRRYAIWKELDNYHGYYGSASDPEGRAIGF